MGACTSPHESTGLGAGSDTFEVKAIDKAGNVDATPATYTWQIDLTAPAVTIDSLSKPSSKRGRPGLTWHADENGSFELRVGGADCTAGTGVLSSGAYSTSPPRVSPTSPQRSWPRA